MNTLFLSCDWGTSSFRLRLVDAATQNILADTLSDEGVARVHAAWLQAQDVDRISFYGEVLQKHIAKLEQAIGSSLKGVVIVLSGMASSTVGMKELPYRPLPFSLREMELYVDKIAGSEKFPHDILLVSGVRSDTDVMRGEEIQLLGCNQKTDDDLKTFVFPGTHSKHVVVEKGCATSLKTYMTGEFFHLLAVNSILSNSVTPNSDFNQKQNETAFVHGVLDSQHQDLLHYSFMVRTHDLFKRFSKEQNYWYLSGLLTGTEVSHLQKQTGAVTIVGEGILLAVYAKAFKTLYADKTLQTLQVNETLLKGHAFIYQHVHTF